jgi:hypothetical protein
VLLQITGVLDRAGEAPDSSFGLERMFIGHKSAPLQNLNKPNAYRSPINAKTARGSPHKRFRKGRGARLRPL